MKTINFTIKAKTVESYLYGGYLFLLMEDGRILYISYRRLIDMLCKRYPQYDNFIQLAFLHNEYFRSKAASLLLSIKEVQQTLRKLWDRATKEIQFEIDFAQIEKECRSMGEWNSMPLDVYMYDMRMFVASRAGLMESRLNPDFNDKNYTIHPTPFEKCFDSKTISVTARAGEIVLAADREGLFHGNALIKDSRVVIDDKSNIPGNSLRVSWSNFDLINYSSATEFRYLKNETANMDNFSEERFRFGDGVERKKIVNFAAHSFDMSDMMARSKVRKENIRYCFNTFGKSFFLLDNGSLVNVLIKKENNDVYYSSYVNKVPEYNAENNKPLKVVAVPNGYVMSFFDKVILYQNGNVHTLENCPSYNIRTYMGSKNYRDIVTITKEDGVSFHSIDVL